MALFKRQSSESKEERRKYFRINRSLRVNYQIGNDALHLAYSTKDISLKGIRLCLYQKLAVGATLKLFIYSPKAKEPVSFLGKVIWTKETPSIDYPFESGIEFDSNDASLVSKIQSFIQSISSK
jgi:c-di-GMP-binding flagellar brake protein YcgR